jgi:hypothetical protein
MSLSCHLLRFYENIADQISQENVILIATELQAFMISFKVIKM